MNLERRDFLKGAVTAGAATLGASVLAACSPADKATSNLSNTGETASTGLLTADVLDQKWSFEIPDDPITDIAETIEADVIVVGAGTAGLVTAYSALEEGLDVIVVSASSKPISRGGSNNAVFSKTMEKMGMERQSARCIENEIAANYNSVDTGKWYKFYQNSETAMNWLIDIMEAEGFQTGIERVSGLEEDHIHYQHLGAHGWYKNAEEDQVGLTQAYLVNTLADLIVRDGGQVIFKNIGRQLVRGGQANGINGRVEAVICEREDGSYAQYVGKKAVVLATGDFSANRDMMAKYAPQAYAAVSERAYDSVDYDKEFVFDGLFPGDGHKMGLWIGAAWQKTYPNCPMYDPTAFIAGPFCMPYGCFWNLLLNREGKRFMNEYSLNGPGSVQASMQPGGEVFAIWDVNYAQRPHWNSASGGVGIADKKDWTPEEIIASWEDRVADGSYVKADTLDELLEKLGVPQAVAKAEIERYNALCEAGEDVDFGKNSKEMFSVEQPPFYGAKTPGNSNLLTICGGLRTDANMRVCDAEDNPIDGLYNVGTMIGDFYAGIYTFQEQGVNYGAACDTFGYLTGKFIAENE